MPIGCRRHSHIRQFCAAFNRVYQSVEFEWLVQQDHASQSCLVGCRIGDVPRYKHRPMATPTECFKVFYDSKAGGFSKAKFIINYERLR